MERSFESGRVAGQNLLALFSDLGYDVEQLQADCPPAAVEQVQATLDNLWSRCSAAEPAPALLGFLSQFLSECRIDGQIIQVWSLSEILVEQVSIAPVCNMPNESGIFAFADWTGETDGDCWCYDIPQACIRCIPVGSGYEDADESRSESYAVSADFQQMVDHLRNAAREREWIT